jgi:Ni/Co efflux regulator RcnB
MFSIVLLLAAMLLCAVAENVSAQGSAARALRRSHEAERQRLDRSLQEEGQRRALDQQQRRGDELRRKRDDAERAARLRRGERRPYRPYSDLPEPYVEPLRR